MNKTSKIALSGLALSAALAAVALPALAREAGPRFGPRIDFEQVDANGDGRITAEELAAHRAARFAGQDSDGDGVLSADEMKAAVLARVKERIEARIDRMIARRDSDGDGAISLAEMQGGDGGERLIERLDTDGDGAISAEELAAMKSPFGKHRRGAGRPGPDSGPEN